MSDSSQMVRTTVNLPAEAVEAIREIARKKGTTMTEVIRQALATERLLYETQLEGGKVLIEDKDKTIKHIILR